MRLLLVRFFDVCDTAREAMRNAVSIFALRRRNAMSVQTAVDVASENVQCAMASNAERSQKCIPMVITVAPETYRWWSTNKEYLRKPMGMGYDPTSRCLVFVDYTDRTLELLRIGHVPAHRHVVKKTKLNGPTDLALIGKFAYC